MSLYARPSWMLVRQVVADLFVLAWGLVWWGLGRTVDSTVRAIAQPGRQVAASVRQVKDNVGGAANGVGEIPYLGDDVRRPFEEMVRNLDGVIASADSQVAAIESTAALLGWLTFLVPVVLLLVMWLPWRARFARRSRATRALVAETNGTDLLALRALATQPLPALRRVAPDPVAAWRSGDAAAIDALAELELARAGVRRPRRLRASPG